MVELAVNILIAITLSLTGIAAYLALGWKLDVHGCSAAGRAEERDCSAECLDPVFETDDAGTAAGVGPPYAVVAD